MPDEGLWEILPFDAGSFTFPEDEPWAGEAGVVVAHLLRANDGRLVLFDTGIGAGHPALDARYHPVERDLEAALAALGHGLAEVVAATNCHLHADHAGQNHRLRGIPIYVQGTERAAASRPGYTIPEMVDGPGVTYVGIDGDVDVLPGLRILASPGHTPGHQSMLVATRPGPVLLAGQAVYSRDEWLDRPGREGRSTARDVARYDESLRRLRATDAVAVHFAHDRAVVAREEEPAAVGLGSILDELREREPIFHRPELGTTREAFEAQTSDDFWEVGASGRRYERAQVLDEVARRWTDPGYADRDAWETSGFEIREAGPGTWLLSYTLRQGDRVTRRLTVWRRAAGGWQALYHQGTIVAAPTPTDAAGEPDGRDAGGGVR